MVGGAFPARSGRAVGSGRPRTDRGALGSQVDISAAPKPFEPENYSYLPNYYKDREEDSVAGADRPTVVLVLEGEDEGAADPEQLAILLAQILGVEPDRFEVEVQEHEM